MKKNFLPFYRIGITAILCLILNSLVVKAQRSLQLNSDSVTAIVTRYNVKQTYRKQFLTALNNYAAQSIRNEHNIMTEAYTEQESPLVFWLIERWDNRPSFMQAGKAAHAKSLALLSEKALSVSPTLYYIKDLEPLNKKQWRMRANESDRPLIIMLFVDAKPGTGQIFKEVYHTAMPQFRSEPGVINYQLSQLDEDSTRFVTYEKFRNESAFQYHLNFPPIQPVLDYLNTSIKKQPFQSGLHRLISITPTGK